MKIQNNAFRMVDAVEVPSLTSDVSFGRAVDAATSWIFFSEPTPYAPNGTVGIGEFESQTFTFYPNPASNNIRFSKNIDSLSLTDAQGRKVGQWTNITNLDVSSLSNGLYLLQMNTETFRLVISR